MMIVRTHRIVAACATTVILLTGCAAETPTHESKAPLLCPYDSTKDPVHIRTPSMVERPEHRGGAAIRQADTTHVLWNKHDQEENQPEKLKTYPQNQSHAVRRLPGTGKDASLYAKGNEAKD